MLRVDLHAKVWVVLNLHLGGKKHATCLGRHTSLAIAEIRPSCGRRSKGGAQPIELLWPFSSSMGSIPTFASLWLRENHASCVKITHQTFGGREDHPR